MTLLSQEGALRMLSLPRLLHHFVQVVWTLLALLGNTACFWLLCLRPSVALAAENLFLRKQLALYQERHIKPRRATDATRLALVWLGRWFDWCQALAIVQPETFTRWHQQGFRLFWRWKSGPGCPPIPPGLCRKFSFEAICGMVSPSDPCCQGGERRWRSASKGPISLKTLC